MCLFFSPCFHETQICLYLLAYSQSVRIWKLLDNVPGNLLPVIYHGVHVTAWCSALTVFLVPKEAGSVVSARESWEGLDLSTWGDPVVAVVYRNAKFCCDKSRLLKKVSLLQICIWLLLSFLKYLWGFLHFCNCGCRSFMLSFWQESQSSRCFYCGLSVSAELCAALLLG